MTVILKSIAIGLIFCSSHIHRILEYYLALKFKYVKNHMDSDEDSDKIPSAWNNSRTSNTFGFGQTKCSSRI